MVAFEIGQCVFHAAGTTEMVVISLDQDKVVCSWQDKEGHRHQETFVQQELRPSDFGQVRPIRNTWNPFWRSRAY